MISGDVSVLDSPDPGGVKEWDVDSVLDQNLGWHHRGLGEQNSEGVLLELFKYQCVDRL
jgi:hypothetical protein